MVKKKKMQQRLCTWQLYAYVLQVVPWLVGPHHWSGTHERRYDHIITSLASLAGLAAYISSTLTAMKESKPRTVSAFLWVFLTYLEYSSAALFLPEIFSKGIVMAEVKVEIFFVMTSVWWWTIWHKPHFSTVLCGGNWQPTLLCLDW